MLYEHFKFGTFVSNPMLRSRGLIKIPIKIEIEGCK